MKMGVGSLVQLSGESTDDGMEQYGPLQGEDVGRVIEITGDNDEKLFYVELTTDELYWYPECTIKSIDEARISGISNLILRLM